MKLEGSGSRVHHRRPAAIEEVAGSIRGVELEMWQRGCEHSEWSVVEAHLDDTVVLSGRMAAPFLALGAADETDLSFAIRLAGDRAWTMNGHTMGARDIAVLGRRGELTSTTAGPIHWLALQISPERLFRYSESIAGRGMYLKHGETHLLTPHHSQVSGLLRALEKAAELATSSPALLSNAALRHALEAQLMHALVRCLDMEPEPLRSHHGRVAQRAVSYLQEHDREVIYVADLCLATGISERWLREALQAVYGTSPMRLLRLRRLNQVHRDLVAGSAGASSVTEVAMAYGFFDLGRFAKAYRQVFGEPPSVTLHKRAMRPASHSSAHARERVLTT
jgi:AraC-like DNA-binding protein